MKILYSVISDLLKDIFPNISLKSKINLTKKFKKKILKSHNSVLFAVMGYVILFWFLSVIIKLSKLKINLVNLFSRLPVIQKIQISIIKLLIFILYSNN